MNYLTLVLGASPNPARYSYVATKRLVTKGYDVIPVGRREGKIDGIEIHTDFRPFENIDTITLYLSPANQKPHYDYILSLNPRRIIFNPGTENPELATLAREAGIESEFACTLVLLSLGTYA